MTEVERIYDAQRIVFPKLGIDINIDNTAFTIFGMDIQWYGIIITFGLLLAMLFCFPKMRKFGLDPDRAIDAIIGGIIAGVIGARAYYVAMKWEDYSGDIKSILNFRNGGLAIYGGIIGAVLIGAIVCKVRKVKFIPMLDVVSMGFLIGQSIGRWGNFVNQEAFGTNTDSIFGMTGGTIQNTIINETTYLDGSMVGLGVSEKYAVHPCFLYESVWCLLGFILLASLIKHRKFDGQLFLIYLAWYGVGRFVIEGLRTDSLMIGSSDIRVSQALAGVLTLSALALLTVTLLKIKSCNGVGFELYVNSDESKELLAQADERNSKQKKVKSENSISVSNSEENNSEVDDAEIDNVNKNNLNSNSKEDFKNGSDN